MIDATQKPVIFLAFANDRDDTVGYLRNLPDEARRLHAVLEPAEQAGLCEVVVRSNSTASDIFKVFQHPKYRNRIAIFHYGGHANGYQLLLESPEGQAAAADAGGLAAFLAQQQGLQMVFLNGCSTQQQTQELLDANISAVISTSRSIDDKVATDFAYQFYQGLAGGASIRTAYNEAEASLQTAQGGNTRALYFGDKDDSPSRLEADRWPWNLYLREGSERADQWNLPDAVRDPLFGLPPLPEQDLPESPYRHLNWFTRQDAEVFFGRGHQIRELYDRLTAPRTAPIILFYGQSGVGKSSILDAGLIPRLEQDHEVRYLRRTAGGLLDTLQLAFLPEASDVPIDTAWRVKEEQTGKPLVVFLDQVEELYTRPIAELPDELEQLLQVIHATFVQSAQRPRGKLVLGFRKEWLAELESRLVAHELPRTKVFLEPLDRRGIIEVVQGPARSARLRERYGLTVEEGLAEIIADDLLEDRGSAIAPTLQILLTKLWTKATASNEAQPRFTQQLYQQLRRDGILLSDFLDQQIEAFRQQFPQAVESGLLLDIVALHTTPLGTSDQRTVEELREQYVHLGQVLPDLLQLCQDLYLLTLGARTSDEEIATRLAHDTLAPLVRQRFEESDRPGQRALRILQNKVAGWVEQGRGDRLDKTDLHIVERGAAGMRAWNARERRLIEASRKAVWWNRIFGVAIAVSLAVAGVIGLAFWRSAALANREQARAERDRIERLIEENMKSGVSERDQTGNVPMAIHYFLQAEQLARQKAADPRTGEPQDTDTIANARLAARFLLRGARLAAMFDMKTESWGTWPIGGAAFNEAGNRVVAWTKRPTVIGGVPSEVRVFDAKSGLPVAPRLTISTGITFAMLNDAGTRVMASDETGAVSYWDVTLGPDTARVVAAFPAADNVQSNFRPDGQSIFVAKLGAWSILDATDGRSLKTAEVSFDRLNNWHFNGDGTHVLAWTKSAFMGWQVNDGAPTLLHQPESEFRVLYVAPDHQQVIVWHSRGAIHRLNPFTGESSEIRFGDGTIQNAFVGGDGSHLVVVKDNGPATVVELASGDKLECGYGDMSGVMLNAIAHRLLTRDTPNGRISLWSTEADSNGFAPYIGELRVRPGSKALMNETDGRLLTWTKNEVRLWDIISGEPVTPVLLHEREVTGARFSPDGRRVLSWSDDEGLLKLWILDEPQPVEIHKRTADSPDKPQDTLTPEQISNLVPRVQYEKMIGGMLSPDGTRLVTWGTDGSARIWDTTTGVPLTPAMRHEVPFLDGTRDVAVEGATFDPDGNRILTWSGQIPFRGYEAAFSVPQYLRIWSSRTGLPLTEKLWDDGWVERAEFTNNQTVASLSPESRREWVLPQPADVPDEYQILDAEVRTGTSLSELGEFSFLSSKEWRKRDERLKSVRRVDSSEE